MSLTFPENNKRFFKIRICMVCLSFLVRQTRIEKYAGGNGNMNEDLEEKMIGSHRIFDGQLLKVLRDTVQLPNGKEAVREWIDHPGAAAVVPILSDGRIVMVRQYRYPVHKITLEIPAGKLDPEEAPEKCALRELKEETGYTAHTLRKLTAMRTAMAYTNETIYLYAAENLDAGAQCTDEDEFINTEIFTPEEIYRMIEAGHIDDSKSIVALLMMKNFLMK